jgi:Holliday junction DNA helicase RuvA
MRMFGFASRRERDLFLNLLTVSGVGPKGAVKILSGMKASDFEQSLENEDVDALSGIPGLGKKTAQKIILQLKGKLASPDEGSAPSGTMESEITDSLVTMGFDRKAAEKTVRTLISSEEFAGMTDGEKEKAVLRRAIMALSQ